MKAWLRSALAASLVAVLAVPMAAAWQEKPTTKPAAAAPAAAPKAAAPISAEALTNEAAKGQKAKPKIIDFEDETIRGTLTKPEGDFIDANKRARQHSLIKIRRHFVPELLKSADDV